MRISLKEAENQVFAVLGAMPPFGNLYGMDTFVAEALAEDAEIAFNAGNHTELIRMAYGDYERLVDPEVAALTIT